MKFYTKKKTLVFFLLLISIVLVSGCVNQEPEKPKALFNITKDGVDYQFTNNIFDSMKIPINNGSEIKRFIKYASAVSVVINSTSDEIDGSYIVIIYNTVEKLKHYYIYSRGKFVDEYFYKKYRIKDDKLLKWSYENNTWVESPVGIDSIEWPVLYFRGHDAGAAETSVTLDESGKIIYIQGTDYRNLSLAADRFALEVLGVNLDLLEQGKTDFS